MKRFDKGYIYSGLLSDLFSSLVVVFIFLKDFFFDENARPEDVIAAIPVFAAVGVTLYLCFILYRILYYKTSGYALTDTQIKCNRGVLFRKRSVLDYTKIHAINKKQTIFHRIFGIAVLTVDSGSTNTAHQAEITIIEKGKTVDALIDELNAIKDGGARAADRSQEDVLLSDEDSLYRFTSKKKMLYTLINIASTAFFTALLAVLAVIVLGGCKLMLQQDFPGTWGEYFLYAVLITVGAMLLFSAFSFVGCMIRSFVIYHKFKITKKGNDIQITYGLLENHTNTFSYDRIKAVKITQGLVQRMLGFASIRLEVIGYTNNVGDDDKYADLGVLVPFCRYDEVGEILAKVLPDYVPDRKRTKAVSYFPFVSWFLLIVGIITATVLLQAVAVMTAFGASAAAVVAVALSLIGIAATVVVVKLISAVLSYRNNGLAMVNDRITSYTGGFTKSITVFNVRNLIAAENVTTPLRKKMGITSMVMHLKTNATSNEIMVHMQSDTVSKELEKRLIL